MCTFQDQPGLLDGDAAARKILLDELCNAKNSAQLLGIGFSISSVKFRMRNATAVKPPYMACCYNPGTLGDVNIVAFYYPLMADWDLMEQNGSRYRQRVEAAVREEMIHAVQVITVRDRYDHILEISQQFRDAETYYESLLGTIIDELATSAEGQKIILTAAQLYYEDWTIRSMEKLRETDTRLHGRDAYVVAELIRQLVQIRFGELTSEEAKGKAWDKNRIFNVDRFGTTENLLKSMADTLRKSSPDLVSLSPTLAEALEEIERTIQRIQGKGPPPTHLPHSESREG